MVFFFFFSFYTIWNDECVVRLCYIIHNRLLRCKMFFNCRTIYVPIKKIFKKCMHHVLGLQASYIQDNKYNWCFVNDSDIIIMAYFFSSYNAYRDILCIHFGSDYLHEIVLMVIETSMYVFFFFFLFFVMDLQIADIPNRIHRMSTLFLFRYPWTQYIYIFFNPPVYR